MDLSRRIGSIAIVCFVLAVCFVPPSYTRNHGRRHKRQHGANLYLPSTFIIPNGGEGYSGDWGEWGSPSECSRTCGGGVAYQTRECLASDATQCSGGSRKYFSCNTQDCADSEPDFRLQQCAFFNTVPFEKIYYNWVPYTKAPNPCELNCMPRGDRFYYRHKSKVIDGTRCNAESLDVCVDGQCQPVGCDLMLGSDAREDKCNKCGGDGSSCRTVSGLLDMNNLQVGYNDILLVPSGATNIKIKEVQPSNNYLAIRNLNGSYYLNGNWRIDVPRPITFAGAIWHYDRRPQGFSAPDHITCHGPTSESVYLVLLYQDRNVGIEFEYSVPSNALHETETDVYAWSFKPYSKCSQRCGGGVQSRVVLCVKQTSLEEADPNLCDANLKPAEEKKCGNEACPPTWVVGEFGRCSQPCGKEGNQTRAVQCAQLAANNVTNNVADSVCLEQVGNKPAHTEPCNTDVACPQWHTGNWQSCSQLCGEGVQKRKVQCYRKDGSKVTALADDVCIEAKPDNEQKCMLRPCEGVDWIVSSWSKCKPCGLTQEARTLVCAAKDGKVYNDSFCANHKLPEVKRPCESATYCPSNWFKSQWSKCSAECGDGIQTRHVFCGSFDGTVVRKTDDETKCGDTEKPLDTQNCTGAATNCKGKWFSGPWTSCSKKCGGGLRTRKVLCLLDGVAVKDSQCSEDTIEFSSEECNKNACSEDETIPVDVTSKPIVEDDDVGEEWCPEGEEGVYEELTSDDPDELSNDIFGAEETLATLDDDDEFMMSDGTEATFTNIQHSTFEGSGDGTLTSSSQFDSTVEGSGSDDLKSTSDSDSSSLSSLANTDASSDSSSQLGTTKPSLSESSSSESSEATTIQSSSVASSYASTASSSSLDSTLDVSSSSVADNDASSPSSPTSSLETTTSSIDVSSSSVADSETTSSTTSDLASSSTVDASSVSTTENTETTETTQTSIETSTLDTSTTDSSTFDTSTTDSSTFDTSTLDTSTIETSTNSESTSDSPSTTDSSAGTTTDNGSSSTSEIITSTHSSTDLTTDGESTTDSATEQSSSTDASAGSTTDLASTTLSVTELTSDSSSSDIYDVTSTTDEPSSTVTNDGTSISDASTDSSDITTETSSSTDLTTSQSSEESSGTDVTNTGTDATTIQSISDNTDDLSTENVYRTTPNTLSSILNIEQKPRKCRVRPKTIPCIFTEFGCCAVDSKTAASGPFDEGCPTPKTCSETVFGCCADNLTPALGKKKEGCPAALCTSSLFGCCSDGLTESTNTEGEGCPVPVETTTIEVTTVEVTTVEVTTVVPTDVPTTVEDNETTTTLENLTYIPLTSRDCARSQFGCCPDGVSEATGELFFGCNIPSVAECVQSEFGCCQDNRTAASGADGAGCAACLVERFGCCEDNKTPAHGPNREGCCLNSVYGCCPDNINEARGPNLEDCGCEYSPFGCCPDNKTSALNANGDGCGCEQSTYGCCLDHVTKAEGPDHFGCPCQTFQFGCCPDGVTVPKGPHEYGCHCSQTEFKCCSDEKTTATGPNFEGCTCEHSKYGCCPDGYTEAKGAKFQGCVDIPVNPQSACSLPKDSGNCTEYVIKYFFDVDYGTCSRFWYGGCEGNGNRFDDQNSCKQTCEEPVGKDVCSLPKVRGPCTGYNRTHYYNSESNTCGEFVYGGCLGNNNRFATAKDCRDTCVVDQASPPCDQPVEQGPCGGAFENWYFDKESDICRPFVYGGCKGNKNRFATEHACNYQCKRPGVPKASCALAKLTGHCSGRLARWHYSQSTQNCVPFYFSGCGGNDNSYVSREQCQESCPRTVAKEICELAADAGNEDNYVAKWYFDTKDGRCRQFYYGGSGGNANNFYSESACLAACEHQQHQQNRSAPVVAASQAAVVTTQRPDESRGSQDHCRLPSDAGECRVAEARFFYNSEVGTCQLFTYGGCGGNENNFRTREDCEQSCLNSQHTCSLPSLKGDCDGNETKWYFDAATERCSQFVYGGCYGNANNFESAAECEDRCRTADVHRQQPRTEAPISFDDRFNADDHLVCSEPLAIGHCGEKILSYFFNKRKQACEAFVYSGCDGNGNRFESKEQCERQCFESNETADTNEESQPTHQCQSQNDNCNALHCEYGESRTYDAEGCPLCACEDPCADHNCAADSTCVVEPQSIDRDGNNFVAVCRQIEKPGECPRLTNTTSSECGRECNTDADCRGDNKCCQAGCSVVCVQPAADAQHSTTRGPDEEVEHHPDARAPALTEKRQEELDVTQPEGQVAQLRCFATGYPLPTVTWRRGAIVLNTNQGRYVLTSTGDLQIVQVHQSDSGTYICVASNGIGVAVERKVELRIAAPVTTSTYILDAGNRTQIATLNQPSTLRCLAGGYPKPSVTWWRGKVMLPFANEQYTVGVDFSLTLTRVGLSDLGEYTCQAYTASLKPSMSTIVLRAYGPVHTTNPSDRDYLKYLIAQVPATPRPDPRYRPVRPTYTRPRPVVEESLIPVTTNIVLTNGNNFVVGAVVLLQCDVKGFPKPVVSWFKDNTQLEPSDRIQITESNRLIIHEATGNDTGYYKCVARNEFETAQHAEQINVADGVYVPSTCVDNPAYANCQLIIKGKFCTHKWYAMFCCRSCTLAGALRHSRVGR